MAAGVEAGHADGVLGRLRTAVGEEHHVEVTGSELGDEAGRLAPVGVGERGGDGAQPAGRLLDGGDQAGVLVADVQVDELGREVQVAAALVVPEPRALAPGDGDRRDHPLGAPGVEHVAAVVGDDGRAVDPGLDAGHAESVGRTIAPEQCPVRTSHNQPTNRHRIGGRRPRSPADAEVRHRHGRNRAFRPHFGTPTPRRIDIESVLGPCYVRSHVGYVVRPRCGRRFRGAPCSSSHVATHGRRTGMFTMQSMQVAQEIQADHRRRATSWRFARRAHRRARHLDELDAAVTSPGPVPPGSRPSPRSSRCGTGAPRPVTNVA